MANQIKYQVKFDVQQNSLSQLKTSLQQIKKINLNDIMKINNTDLNSASTALRQVQQDAEKVENALNKAFNAKLNTLNIQTFNKQLASSNLTIEKVHQSFSRAGTAGQSAFNSLAAQILNTNVQLRQSNKLLDSMATSMANTIKWGITSSIFNNMTRSIQSAYNYAKDLDRSLTDIRIVTGDSADQMERFAQTANSAAKDLGRSTLDYTKAALTYYQQGLSDDEVQARTEATLKAENITGAGAEMADYLTAVWNGFKVGAEDAEEYVDKLAAVADTTASNMGQLATAISKVASAASNVGVDIDQLNGQIATVIATTRQAPESVGVAFKTIYARINDIKAGTDQAEISLGNYSSKMAQLGFNVLDASGHLRDTGEVIEEIGASWENLTREQQIYLAQTMAGQRQYNNLIALFDNWDQYLQSVNTSLNAQGTLNEKNDRYLESLEAHMQQLGTEAERTYDILFDEKTVKGFVDSLSGALNIFNNFIKGIGGGTNAFVYFGSLIAGIFNKQIAQAIRGVEIEIDRFKANLGIIAKQDIINKIKSGLQIAWAGEGKSLGNEALTAQATAAQKTLVVQRGLTAEQQKQAVEIQKQIGLETQRTQDLQQKLDKEREENQLARDRLGLDAQAKTLSDQQKQDLQNKLIYYKQIQSESKNILSIFTQTEIAIKDENANAERRTQLAVEFRSHQKEIQQEYRKAHGSLQGFNELWQQTLQGIVKGKDYLEAFNKIQDLIRGQANDTGEIIQHINNLLTNQTNKTEQQLQESKEVTKEYQRQNDILAQQGKHTVNIQRAVRGMSAAGQALSAWAGAAKTFGDQMATVQEKVNATFSGIQGTISGIGIMFGPIGMGVATLTNGIISFAKESPIFKNWLEDIEDEFKTTKQRVDQLNESMKKTNEISTNYANDKKSIQGIADEFQTLSAKAGKYNQNISSMSQEEQSRYRELVQQIINKNPELIAGYTAQGDAIIANNEAIKSTLDYLDQQYQKEMAILYAKENVANAEKILKEKDQAATKAEADQSNYNKNNEQFENVQSIWVEKARGLTSIKTSGTYYNAATNENIKWYKDNYEEISAALQDLTDNTNFDDIQADFQKYIDEYNEVVNNTNNLEQIEEARQNLYNNISSLKEKVSNIDWDSIPIGGWFNSGIQDSTQSIITEGLDTFLTNIDQLDNQLRNAEQKVQNTVARLNTNAASTSQELQTALVSYQNYLLGALRYDPSYNTQFSIIRDQWGENFTPQIESLLGSIMEDWVSTTLNVNYEKYVSEEDMTGAIVEDYNTFIRSIFNEINAEDLMSVTSEVSNLMAKTEELSAKDFEDQFKRILKKFINSDTLQKIAEQDLKQNGNLDLTNIFLQSIFGDSAKVAVNAQGNIYGIYDSVFRKIIKNVRTEYQDILRTELEAAGYSQTQLNALAADMQEKGLHFSHWRSVLVYAQNFFKQTGEDIGQGGDKLLEGFDKVGKAIDKIQSGKDLTYKDKLNLMQYLGLNEQEVQNTEKILDTFKEKIKGLEGLERYEGLSKIFTDFETLDKYKEEFGVTEEQQASLLQDIIDKELAALGEDETFLENWAKQRGIILDGSVQKTREAVEALKLTRNLDELGTLAQTAKKGGEEGEDAILRLQVKLKQLTGKDYTTAQVTEMLDAIAAAAQDDGVQIQNVLDLMDQLANYNPKNISEKLSSAEKYRGMQSTSTNLSGAYDALSTGKELTDEQSTALNQLILKNEQLAELSREQGINSQAFLKVLQLIVQATEQEAIEAGKIAIQELKAKQARLSEQINSVGTKTEDIRVAEKLSNWERQLQETTAQRLAIEQQLTIEWQKQADAAQTIDQLESAKLAGMDENTFNKNLDEVAGREAKSLGLNEDEVLDYATALQECADQSDDLADSLEDDRDASLQLAIAGKRLTRGIKDLAQNFDKYNQQINSDNIEEQAQGFGHLRDAMGDVLNIDGNLLTKDFLTDNLQDMKLAAEGDIEAIDRLRQAAADDIIQQCLVKLDGSDQVKAKLLYLSNQIESFLSQDMQLGVNLDDSDFIAKCNKLVTEAGMTQQQIQGYFNSLGFDPKISYTEANSLPVESSTTGTVNVAGLIDIPYTMTAVSTTKVQVPKIDSLTKIGGGSHSSGITHAPAPSSSGSKGGRGGGGGSKSPKKSGSKKNSKSDKKDLEKPLEDQRDIYHDINIQLSQLERNFDRIQKDQEKLYGKQLLDNLNKQQKLLDKQIETLRRKQKLQEQDLANQKQKLKGLGVEVNDQGDIVNYMDILGQKQNKVNSLIAEENALIQKRNKLKKKEKQDALDQLIEQKKKEVDAAKDDLDETKNAIDNYDDLRDDMEDLLDQIEQIMQKQFEINIEKFNAKVEVSLELGQAERDWNEFRRNVLENNDFMTRTDFDDIFSDLQQNVNDFSSYFSVHGNIGEIEVLTNHLADIRKEINEIDQKGQSAIYGKDKARALKDLQDNLDKLMDQMQDIEKISEDIDKAYLDTIDDIKEQFDKQGQEYEYVNDLIQHNMDLLSLLYGDKNYDAMNSYYEELRKSNLDQLESLRMQRDFWKQQMENAVRQGDTKAAEAFRENYKDVIQDLNNLIKESAETVRDEYSNAIEGIFDDLDKKVSNGHGTDYLSTDWDLMNKNADEYLDNINSAFAIQQTERKYQNAINDTKNIKNQQALKKLMGQQLDILKNKEKLTQYDVDRAEKLLQVEQARIALQDARSAKTTMRLKRDSQGNYSYEYMADEDAIKQAEENLAAAENDLYNFDKDRYKSNLDDMLSAWKDFKEQYKEIVLNTKDDQQRVEKLALLETQYTDFINGKLSENSGIRNNLMDSAFKAYAGLYNTDVDNYKKMTDQQQQLLMQNLVPTWNSGVQQMTDAIIKEGGLVPTCEKAFADISNASDEYWGKIDQISKTSGLDLEEIKTGSEDIADTFKEAITKNEELVTAMGNEITAVEALRDAVQSLKEQYQEAYNAAKDVATVSHDFLQQQKKEQYKTFDETPIVAPDDHSSSQTENENYTGDWNNNDEDKIISEILDTLQLKNKDVRSITSLPIVQAVSQTVNHDIFWRINGLMGHGHMRENLNNREALEQNVHIEAVFPNVNTVQDIEKALFNDLPNVAAQKIME